MHTRTGLGPVAKGMCAPTRRDLLRHTDGRSPQGHLRLALCAGALMSSLLSGPLAAQPANVAHAAIRVPTLLLRPQSSLASFVLEGTIQPVRQSTVGAQASGNIVALLVKAGDNVRAGQVLARIDAREAQAGLARSQAEVAQAEAQLNNARLQWERSQQLKAQSFISAAALDTARTQWRAAQAALAAVQAGRAQATLAKDFATVTAPFDGRVMSTQAERGDLALPGRPILTLYAPQALRAVVQVPASQAAQARSARVINVLIPPTGANSASQVLHPSHVTALPGADPVSQTVEWRLDLPATIALPGQTVQVQFEAPDVVAASGMARGQAPDNEAALIQVPAAAVLRRGELTAVYVVREGRFMLQAVRTGPASAHATRMSLLSGVKPGDVIAADAIQAGLAQATPAPTPSAQP
jgi:RND family efflux transporter MFP subunit